MDNQHNREDHAPIGRRAALEHVFGAAVAGALFGGSTKLAAAGQPPRTSGPNMLGSGGVRRVVTANDAQGKSFIVSDQRITTGEFPSLFKATGDNPLGPGAPGEMKEFLPTDAPQIEPSLGGS